MKRNWRLRARPRHKEQVKLDVLRPEPTSWRVCSGSEQLQHGPQAHHSLVHRPGQELPRPQTHTADPKFFTGSDCVDFRRCRRPSVFPSVRSRVHSDHMHLRAKGLLCLVWFSAAVVAGEFKAVSLHFLKSRSSQCLRCDANWGYSSDPWP